MFALWDEANGGYYANAPRRWVRVDTLEDAELFPTRPEAVAVAQGLPDLTVIQVGECDGCGKLRGVDELASVEVARATWDSPAEYADVCQWCLTRRMEQHEAAMDRYWDRKLSASLGK